MFMYICAMFKKLYRRYLLWRYQRLFKRLLMSRSNERFGYALERAKLDFEWITGVEWDECLKILMGEWAYLSHASPHLSSPDKKDDEENS